MVGAAIMQIWSQTSARDDGENTVPQLLSKESHRPGDSAKGFCGHPENVLLAMITDEPPHLRELGLRRIMKARSHVSANKIRRFRVPPLNLDATECQDMVDWQTLTVTEPPVTMDMTDNELNDDLCSNFTKCPLPSLPFFYK
jgi:hypothetical protein